jgi:integrase
MRRKLDRPNFRLRWLAGKRGGSWYIDWTEAGKPRSLSTRTGDKGAAEQQRQQLAAGWDKPPPPEQPTIGAILDGYLAERRSHVEAYATLDYACRSVRRHIGGLLPAQLSRRTYWDRRRGDGVSAGTIIREGVTLRAALAWAVREKWIAEAPYVQLPPKGPSKERWLTREEADRLIGAARTPHVRLFVLLALHTSARRAAILGLEWERVDLERRLVHFQRPGRVETKKRRTTVPINDALIGPLQEAYAVRTCDHVIEYKGRAVASIKTAFNAAVERAGIADCSPHDLRRTAGTWLALAGIDMGEIARFLGDTVAVTERHYAKHHPGYLANAAKALAGEARPALIGSRSPKITS